MGFTVLVLVFIFVGWFTYERNKVSHIEKKQNSSFWENENLANSSRKRDISQLEYIKLPLEFLPCPDTKDPIISDCMEKLRNLEDKKILNLTGISNTELKLAYGPANLPLLTEYDQNFTQLVRILNKLGNRLEELDFIFEATSFYEFAIECGSDISNTYYALANLYIASNQSDKISYLIAEAEKINSLSKKSIISKLTSLLENA